MLSFYSLLICDIETKREKDGSMALRELRDSALLNVLKNDSSRRDWAVQDSANDVQLPPAPDTWSVVSSTVEAVARGGINLVDPGGWAAHKSTAERVAAAHSAYRSGGPGSGSGRARRGRWWWTERGWYYVFFF